MKKYVSMYRFCFIEFFRSNQINRSTDHESDFLSHLHSFVPNPGLQWNLVVAGLKRLRC